MKKPNNVWSGLKHSGRTLTLRFVMLTVRSLFRSTEWCSASHVLHARTDRDVHVSDLVRDSMSKNPMNGVETIVR